MVPSFPIYRKVYHSDHHNDHILRNDDVLLDVGEIIPCQHPPSSSYNIGSLSTLTSFD